MATAPSEAPAGALDPGGRAADGYGVPLPRDHLPELLVLCREPATLGPLFDVLCRNGVTCETAPSLDALREAFLARGGHDALLLAPDVERSQARRAAHALRAVDPGLLVVAFGRDLQRADLPEAAVCLAGLHPTSRAGIGAVLRLLANHS
jgi:hypothetical protein